MGTFQPARARLSTSALGALPRLSGANPLLCDASTSAPNPAMGPPPILPESGHWDRERVPLDSAINGQSWISICSASGEHDYARFTPIAAITLCGARGKIRPEPEVRLSTKIDAESRSPINVGL